MRRLLKAVLTGAPLGDTSTIEDEGSIEDIKATYAELRKQLASSKINQQTILSFLFSFFVSKQSLKQQAIELR